MKNSVPFAYPANPSDTWFIGSPAEIALKAKIEEIGTPLKDWNDKINYGIKTGCNEAFIIDHPTRDELIAADPNSAEIIRPILRGKDIKRYCYHFAEQHLATHNGYTDSETDDHIPPIDIGKLSDISLLKHLSCIPHISEQIRSMKKPILLLAILLFSSLTASAATTDEKLRILYNKIVALEKRVAELESKISAGNTPLPISSSPSENNETPAPATTPPTTNYSEPVAATDEHRAILKQKAYDRSREDKSTFTEDDLREIEELYQFSNDRNNRGTTEAVAKLEELVRKYPKANRTGCGVLYMSQWASGEKREKLLRQAIDNHFEDRYFNGVQVGPYALFQLGHHYKIEMKDYEKAKECFDKLRANHPDAIDHKGQILVSRLR